MNPSEKQLDLDCTRLPPAPHVLLQLVDLCHKTDVSFIELESIISKDSALCAKVIALSNSAAFNQWNESRDLKRILVVLGTKTVRSIALTSIVHQFFSQYSQQLGETMGDSWLDALICAHLSRNLATLTGYQYPDEAHLAGLLHQLGQLVLLSNEPDQYQLLLQSVTTQDALLLKEQERYGINSADLAHHIMSKWGLESMLAEAIKYQYMPDELMHDTKPLIKIINLSSRISNRINHSNNSYLVEDHFFGLHQALIENLVSQSTQAAINDARSFGMNVTEDSAIPRANIDDEEIRIRLAHKIHQIALLDGVQQHASDINDVSELFKLVSENLQLIFGLSPEIIFLPDISGTVLSGISTIDNTPDKAPVSIKLKPYSSLIAESGLRKTILYSSAQSIFDELNVIDRQIKSLLEVPEFICLPLLSQNSLIGVIAVGCKPNQAAKLKSESLLLENFCKIIADTYTRQQRLSRQLEESQQQEKVAANLKSRSIVHEINNPLTIINNYLELVSMDMDKEGKDKQNIDIIKSEVERVSDLLLQLKQDPEDNHHNDHEVDINQLIEKQIAIFKPTFYKLNNISSELKLDPNLPPIPSDTNKLKQIISNLVKNAAEALPDKGIISISTKPLVILNNKKYIEISVSDNGTGVPDNILNQLFSPVESTKGSTHSGLGLTIVNQLTTDLNGRISYSSSSQGGAKFTILLPVK